MEDKAKRKARLITEFAALRRQVLGPRLPQVKTERVLKRTSTFYEVVIDFFPAFFVGIDAGGKLVLINDAMLKAAGYTRAEVIGKDYLSTFVPQHERKLVVDIFKKVVKAREIAVNENHVLSKDGREILLEWHGRPIVNECGDLEFFIGVGIDITDRRAAEIALETSERNYREIFNAVNDSILTLDSNTGDILDLNQRSCEIFGYTLQEIRRLKLRIGDLSLNEPPYTQQDAMAKIQRALETGPQVFEWLHKERSGRQYWTEVNLKPAMIGDKKRVLAVVRDINDRKSAELALKSSERRYITLVENSLSGIFVEQNEEIVFTNATFDQLFRYSDNELRNLKVLHLFHSEDRDLVEVVKSDCLKGLSNNSSYESRCITKHNQTLWIIWRIVPIDFGQRPALLWNIVDITKLKEMQVALRESEEKLHFLSSQLLQAQEKERARISKELHDEVGQSLSFLKLQVRSLARKLSADQAHLQMECKNTIDYIDQTIENVRRLVLDLSPSIVGDLGLSAALRWLINKYSAYYKITTSFEVDDLDLLASEESSVAIYRIFQESLANIARHAFARNVSILVARGDEQLLFCLEDDGEGFDVAALGASKLGSRGLGLATMDERVRILGGTLDITSSSKRGTHIIFSIPIRKKGVLS